MICVLNLIDFTLSWFFMLVKVSIQVRTYNGGQSMGAS